MFYGDYLLDVFLEPDNLFAGHLMRTIRKGKN